MLEYAVIEEPLEVNTKFLNKKIFPLSFVWKNKKYKVIKINGRWEKKEGYYNIYCFALTADSENVYEIEFNTRELAWTLKKTYWET